MVDFCYYNKSTIMSLVTKEDVDKWWEKRWEKISEHLKDPNKNPSPGPDPRGKAPSHEHMYDYDLQMWVGYVPSLEPFWDRSSMSYSRNSRSSSKLLDNYQGIVFCRLKIAERKLREAGLCPKHQTIPQNAISFRVPIPDTEYSVSISGVKIMEWSDPDTECIETALVGPEGNLVYIPELGYENVCLSENVEELVTDIRKLFQDAKEHFSKKK